MDEKNRSTPSLNQEKSGFNFDNLENFGKKLNYFQFIFANNSSAEKVSENLRPKDNLDPCGKLYIKSIPVPPINPEK